MGSLKGFTLSILSFVFKAFFVCFFVSLFFILILLVLVFAGSMKSSDVASWVQAVGSIGAIAGAYAVANWQLRKQKKQQDQDRVNRIYAMCAVVRCAAEHIESTRVFLSKHRSRAALDIFWVHMSGSFEASMEALKILPVHELGKAELVINCMFIIGVMNKLQSEINQYIKTGSDDKLEEAYSKMEIHARLSTHSWGQFSMHAGISSELQDYNV